ncbi:MAG: alpha/beta hydrolase [Traorella sp.]
MFEKLKRIFVTKNEPAPLILTVHGFGVRREHEMDDFVEYAKLHLYEVKTFNLFELDENDHDYHKWVERAEDALLESIKNNRKIYLLGFSMGGVIASYLASKYPVEKLILISPAFIHFNIENYANMAIKTGKKMLSSSDETKPSLPKNFYGDFVDCVKEHKNDIKKVTCPVLIIQGDEDEIIPVRSSSWGYDQIEHDRKQLVYLHLGKHRILSDEKVKEVAFCLIDDFIHDKL